MVAPSSNYSGAGAAVGSVTDRTTIPYQRAYVEGAEAVEAYGLDASPALSVIAGALGAVGPKPDLVLSGINHGVNVGPLGAPLGTVGAALTASQLGISALAVSLRVGDGPDPWESAADLAVALIPLLVGRAGPHGAQPERAPPPLAEIRGLRWARVSGAGLIKAARGAGAWEAPNARRSRGRRRPRRRARSWRASRTRRARSCSPSDRPSPTRATSAWPTRGRGRHAGRPGLRRPHRAARTPGRRGRGAAGPTSTPGSGAALAGFDFTA